MSWCGDPGNSQAAGVGGVSDQKKVTYGLGMWKGKDTKLQESTRKPSEKVALEPRPSECRWQNMGMALHGEGRRGALLKLPL